MEPVKCSAITWTMNDDTCRFAAQYSHVLKYAANNADNFAANATAFKQSQHKSAVTKFNAKFPQLCSDIDTEQQDQDIRKSIAEMLYTTQQE